MLKLIREQLITRLDHTYRFNGTPIIPPAESVSQHSYWVIFYTNLLLRDIFWLPWQGGNDIGFKKKVYYEFYNFTIRQAMFHDVGEIFTSDILFHTKNHPAVNDDIKNSLNRIIRYESNRLEKSVFDSEMQAHISDEGNLGITDLNSGIKEIGHKIVKVADWISCYHFAYNQYSLGNKLMIDKCEIAIVEMRKVLTGLATALEASGLPYSRSSLESILN